MSFLIPLLVGSAIMGLTCWREMPKRARMNRPLVASAMLSGSLLWWAATAILLVRDHKYFGMLNVLSVFFFSVAIICFLPAPSSSTNPKAQNLITNGIVVFGVLLGLAHAVATGFTSWWPQILITAYARIGIH